MPKWEYGVVLLPSLEIRQEQYLNELSKEGWEVITVDSGKGYLRRLLRLNMPSETKELNHGQERQGAV